MKGVLSCALLLFVHYVRADIYLHYPRGSNNRLNERSAQRANGNRVFDSQVSCHNIGPQEFFNYVIICGSKLNIEFSRHKG